MSKLDILANDLRGLCFHQIGAGELSEHLVKLGYHKLLTPDSKEYQELLLTDEEMSEVKFDMHSPWGLVDRATVGVAIAKAQVDKVLALLGGKE